MTGRDFLDTNVLVYSFDEKQPAKRDRAREIIARALRDGSAIISYQVVQEFLNVALHKFISPFNVKDCGDYLTGVLEPLCQVYPDTSLYRKALDVHSTTGFSFYDSLIIVGAMRGQCSCLLTEDMQTGREIEGVKIVNPFPA
jgi:predicted nucleic acid-binding protein